MLFICQIIPPSLLTKYDVSQAQTMFCLKLLNSKHFDNVVSLVQTNVIPNILSEIDHDEINYVQNRFFPQKGCFKLLNNIFSMFINVGYLLSF